MPYRFDSCHAALKRNALTIFLFHGVIPKQQHKVRNYTKKHLLEQEFEIALRNLKMHGNPVSMPEVLKTLEERGEFPSYAYAVTFDDGFENNLTVAAPVLRRHSTPAAFYVCSSFIEHNRMSWTDQIENAFERAGEVKLDVPELGPTVDLVSDSEKIRALDAIRAYVKSNPALDPYQFALGIVESIGKPAAAPDRWLDTKLTWKQVGQLAADPLFEVGAHGHSHKILAFLPDAELDFEIAESVGKLRKAVGRSGEHFSYPEGLEHCFSERVIERLKAHGIKCSPTAIEGTNPPGTDPFHLRRMFVI